MVHIYNYNLEIANLFSEILANCRNSVGLSRQKIGNLIGVSESTVKAWETGQGAPNLSMLLKWFKETGVNPYRSMLDFFWPKYFRGLTAESGDEKIINAVIAYIKEVASASEIKKFYHLFIENKDLVWNGMLDISCAYTHLPMVDRYRVAEIINLSYELGLITDKTNKKASVPCNKEVFVSAIKEARCALKANKLGYTISDKLSNIDSACSKIMLQARIKKGVTRKNIAKALGKSERTIINWEQDHSVSILDMCRWFHVLNVPVWPYLRSVMFSSEPLSFTDEDKLKQTELLKMIKKLKIEDVRKICYLILGNYGSNWFSILEMFLEYSYLLDEQKIIISALIVISYIMAKEENLLVNTKNIAPNIENLRNYIDFKSNNIKKREI